MVDPVSAAAAAKYVYGAFSTLSRGLSKKDKRALQASGATTAVRGLQIDGQRVTQRQSIRAGRAVLAAQASGAPQPVPRSLPTGGDLLDDLLNRPHQQGRSVRVPSSVPDFERILNQPQQPYEPKPPSELDRLLRRSPTAIRAARLAYTLARAGSLVGALFYPSPTADSDLGYRSPRPDARPASPPFEPPSASKGPKTRSRPSGRPPRFPRVRYEPFPETAADRLPPRTPQPEARTLPRPRSPLQPSVLHEPVALPRAVSNPRPGPGTRTQPRAVPVPTAVFAPHTLSLPSPLSVLPFMLPRPSQQPTPRLSNPLQAAIEPSYRPGVSDRPLTAPLPQPLAFAPPTPSEPCGCTKSGSKPKRKRKQRTECYRGTFTETRRSTSKIRKEKIKCQ